MIQLFLMKKLNVMEEHLAFFSKNIIISHYLHQKRQIISYVRIIPTGN